MIQRTVIVFAAVFLEFTFILYASENGDLSMSGSAVRLVGALLGAGVCSLVAACFWPRQIRHGARWLWASAIVLRAAALPMEPCDDFWRYVWEGRVQNAGFNPYLHAPDSPVLGPVRDFKWMAINHRSHPAIYPPGAELAFRAIARLAPLPANSVWTILLFKCVFVAADLATLALLLRLLRTSTLFPVRRAAWYALNPAVIHAFAGAGHYDSLMLCALTAAILCATYATRRTTGMIPMKSAVLAAAALGVAISVKIVPVFLLPAFAAALRRRSPVLLLALAIPAVLSIPFGGFLVLRPLLAFAEVSRFNDLIWWLVEALTVRNPFGRNWPFTLTMVITVGVIAWRFRRDWPRALLWSLGAMLILSPVLHPWYLTWILPVAVWRGERAWTVMSLSALSALLLWETTPWWNAWEPNPWTRLMVLLPPLAWWLAECIRKKRARLDGWRAFAG